jgi:hypothetical protein
MIRRLNGKRRSRTFGKIGTDARPSRECSYKHLEQYTIVDEQAYHLAGAVGGPSQPKEVFSNIFTKEGK